MSLIELLTEKKIATALIVDDACDRVPTADDIGPGNEAWTVFNDDLGQDLRTRIAQEYPQAAERRFDELIADNAYIATLWRMREELGALVGPVFEAYDAAQAADMRYVDVAVEKLSALGLKCETAGRQFEDKTREVDIILIDLFFNKSQDDAALNESKEKLRSVIAARKERPPLVILMSRSHRLESKREEFRDDVGLLDSGFRIIRKSDMEENDRLERQLARLAENFEDSRNLAGFFAALELGMTGATQRTLKLLRKLRLSDIGQIQQLLLSVEGEPTGSYLVDVFDRVLQHEIEREAGIIKSALALNEFGSANHPPPYVAGSPDLQELVERLLTQNVERLKLPGALDAPVAFGDVLRMTAAADAERLKKALLVDANRDAVLLVLTPACDLQRDGAPRILLLVGRFQPLDLGAWSYGSDARTSAIRVESELGWIKWNLKHIDTVSRDQLVRAFNDGDLQVVARLREAHALEIQQRVLSGLGRVGLVAALPATFPVDLEVYRPNEEGVPVKLDVPALSDGAVCFSGRDQEGDTVLKLVLTDHCTDGVIEAISAIEEEKVSTTSHQALGHVKNSADLRRMLTDGISLKGVGDKSWSHISSMTGAQNGVPKMGLLAWNLSVPETALEKRDLNKAGVIFVVRDRGSNAPGLGEVIRSGLVEAAVEVLSENAAGGAVAEETD